MIKQNSPESIEGMKAVLSPREKLSGLSTYVEMYSSLKRGRELLAQYEQESEGLTAEEKQALLATIRAEFGEHDDLLAEMESSPQLHEMFVVLQRRKLAALRESISQNENDRDTQVPDSELEKEPDAA